VLAIDLGRGGVELTLREWVNSGLMTFFFFVLGLEARREFDLGDFRERRRLVLPLLASAGGMGAAVAIYLAFNLGSSAAEGRGIAMSTDTAFALGLLTMFGRGAPDRLRAFMLTVVIADDLLALVVIALVYSDSVDVMPLIWMAGLFAVALALVHGFKLRRGAPYFVVGSAMAALASEAAADQARSGRCMTSCSSTRTSCSWPIWCRTPIDSGSTWRASPRTCKGTSGPTGSPKTWRART
jgi:Na+/H+ antiporter NhaA